MEEVGPYAFRDNPNLSCKLTLPDSLTSIAGEAFLNDPLVQFDSIANSDNPFINDSSQIGTLKYSFVDEKHTHRWCFGFDQYKGQNTLFWRDTDVYGFADNCFESNALYRVKKFFIPTSTFYLATGMFARTDECDNDVYLSELYFPISCHIKKIPYSFMQNLTSLKTDDMVSSIIFPNSIESIDQFAFEGTCLSSLYLPDSVTFVGGCSFIQSNISVARLSNSLVTIDDSAFVSTPLVSIDIPSSVRSLGDSVFCGCKYLQSINFLSPVPSFQHLGKGILIPYSRDTSDVFWNNNIPITDHLIHVRTGSKDLYKNAFPTYQGPLMPYNALFGGITQVLDKYTELGNDIYNCITEDL